VFVQIGDENVHLVRSVMDEVFGSENFCSLITYSKTTSATGELLPGTADYILWYARDRRSVKYRPVFVEKEMGGTATGKYDQVEMSDRSRRGMSVDEKRNPRQLRNHGRPYRLDNLTSQSIGREKGEGAASWFPVMLEGREFRPTMRSRWKTNNTGPSGWPTP
jgi:adenine-specific DNA-methyltransferase